MLWSLRYCSKFAVEKLPQISQILTDVRACISPTESTDFTEFFPARKFCVNLWENISARKFCVFCGFCGKISQQKEIYFLMLWSLRYCVGDMPRWLFVNLPKNERLGKPSSSEISLIERLERRRYFSIAFTV